MNTQRSNPLHTTRYRRTNHKTQGFDEHYSRTSASIQSLSHNLASPIPLENPNSSHCIACIGKYLLLEQLEGEHVFRAANLHNGEELICKVFDITRYRESLVAYFSLSAHKNLNHIVEIILGDTGAYVFFETSYGDTYSFLRSCKRLNEDEAAKLFYQMASAVAHCHDNGLVLRDLKLRKFVFKNKERNLIKLESLEDAHILDGEDDSLSDKGGSPAYVSPEALKTSGSYSGKAADVWSLGVMLYRILVGRYPFQDAEPCSLFSKISQGQFCIPDTVTPKAKCLICSILRQEPGERLTSREILDHPWFSPEVSAPRFGLGANNKETSDQMVPDMKIEEEL